MNAEIIRSLDDAERAAKALAASGYFADAKQAAQALVKILAGREFGVGPFAAMSGIQIISGRPALSAQLVAAIIKRGGRKPYSAILLRKAAATSSAALSISRV